MDTERDLIDLVKDRQGSESDEKFAARLGIHRTTWRLLKQGGMRPGRLTLQGIMAAYPDLTPNVLRFLMPQNDRILVNPDSKESEPAR